MKSATIVTGEAWTIKFETTEFFAIVEYALACFRVIDKVLSAVDSTKRAKQVLTGSGVGDRILVENLLPLVLTVLPDKAITGVLIRNLQSALIDRRLRSATDPLAAIDIAIGVENTQLLLTVIGEVGAVLLDQAHRLTQVD